MGRQPNNGAAAMTSAERQKAYRDRLKFRRLLKQQQRVKEVRRIWARPQSTLMLLPSGPRKKLARLLDRLGVGHRKGCPCPECDVKRMRQQIGFTWQYIFDVGSDGSSG
jgi:hypothetical protein